ncbi:phage tail tape measure protein [Serratia fonticola]|uniref:phage tail tape measure protein n=1 Tax=Serratia fonticola TaxID=47917 RepID=UPI00192CC8B0|nr:phage tail tape measure protein [Serratia fonticola]MBL5864500.1 phage tail tape measure protein [Serratia fonticola]
MADRKLQIQVALGAVNNLSRPLDAAQKSSAALASQIKNTRASIKQLSTSADSFDKLSAASAKTTARIEKIQRAADAVRSLENPTQKQIAAVQRWDERLVKLRGTQEGQIQRLVRLRGELKQHGVFVDKNSNATQAAARYTEQYNRQLAEQERRLKQIGDARTRYAEGREFASNLRGVGTSALMVGAAMGAPIALITRRYSSLEDAMKGVAKQVDGLLTDDGQRTARYYEVQKLIQEAAAVTPLPGGGLDYAALIEGGGRMGVAKKDDTWADQRRDLLAFADTAAKASKAFELPAGELAEDLGKIANLYRIPIKDIESLGDAINYLDDNAQSKGADIIDVLKRMGGNAERMGYKQAAALGSTFLSLGTERELAASASNAMVRELSIASMQSDKFTEALNVLGINAKKLEVSMATDAMGTIRTVLNAVSKLPEADRLKVLTQLFGKEFGDDAAKLANNLGELDRQLALLEGTSARGSMAREANIDKDSLSSQWGLLKAGLSGLAEALGSTLRPQLMALMAWAQKWLTSARAWVAQNKETVGTVVRLTAAIAGLSVGFGALLITTATIMNPLKAIQLAFSLITGGGAPGAVGLLAHAFTFLKTSMLGAFNGVMIFLGGLTWPIVAIGAAVVAIGAALIAVGLIVYKYWEPIKAWFSGFWSGLVESSAGIIRALSPLTPVFDAIGRALGWVWEKLKGVWGWFTRLVTPVKSTREELDKATESGKKFGMALGEAISMLWAPFAWLKDQIIWVLEKLNAIPEQAERIRIAAARANSMNNAMPGDSHTPKAGVIRIQDPKTKKWTTEEWKPNAAVKPGGDKPTENPPPKPPAIKPAGAIWGKNPDSGKSGAGSGAAGKEAEKRDPNKLGDIVFKNVAPHIALASPYLTAQREQARAINGLTKAADALRKSTTGLDKFGSIGLGQGSFAGVFAEPQKQQTSLLTQLRMAASGMLQRAQDWIGGGTQLAFAGAGAVLAPQANQRTLLARPEPVTIEGNTYHLSFDLKEAGQLDERKIAMLVKEQITDIERQKAMRNRSQLRDRE